MDQEQKDEMKRQIDEAVQKARAEIEAEYSARARWFRYWITQNPLPAARVIGTVGIVTGIAIGYFAAHLLGV